MKFIDLQINGRAFRLKMFGVEFLRTGVIWILNVGPIFHMCGIGKLTSFEWGRAD